MNTKAGYGVDSGFETVTEFRLEGTVLGKGSRRKAASNGKLLALKETRQCGSETFDDG